MIAGGFFIATIILYLSLIVVDFITNGMISFYWPPLIFHSQFVALFILIFYLNKLKFKDSFSDKIINWFRGIVSFGDRFIMPLFVVVFLLLVIVPFKILTKFGFLRWLFDIKIFEQNFYFWIWIILFGLGLTWFNRRRVFISKLFRRSQRKLWLKRLFVIFIFLFLFFSFLDTYATNYLWLNPALDIYNSYLVNLVTVAVFICGVTVCYLERSKINEIVLDKRSEKKFSWKKKYLPFLLVFGVLVGLSIPLWFKFMSEDGWHIYSVAKGFLETGQCVAWSFLYDAPGYYYSSNCFVAIYLSGFFAIFGESVVVAKIALLPITFLVLLVAYLLVKKLFDRHLALLVVVFFATNPFFIFTANYVRVYIFIFLAAFLLYYLMFKWLEIEDYNWRKILGFLLAIGLLMFVGFEMRAFFISLLPAVVLIVTFKLLRFSKVALKKERAIVAGSLLLIASAPLINYFKDKYWYLRPESTVFRWYTFTISFFDVDPLLIKIIFATLLFLVLMSVIELAVGRRKKINHWEKSFLFLAVIFITVHLIYGVLVAEGKVTHRYVSHIMPINFIILFFGIYYYTRVFFRKSTLAVYVVGTAMIVLFNGYFWTHSDLNGPSGSWFNYVDMYWPSLATDFGRLKSNYEKAFYIINASIDIKNDKKVALIISPFNAPELKILQDRKDVVDIISIVKKEYLFTNVLNRFYNWEDYEFLTELGRYQVKKSALDNYLKKYDKVFVVWQARKSWKWAPMLEYLESLNFDKISGLGIDDTNVEVYMYFKNQSVLKTNL